ncbi:condensation-domain-containing protein [Didymella exigua CBS 183.55]|uniref:Condensation-domain-containing protein n=1 Tax=Didymella exigua CBS 183.55 TaxID=1150837 RepID=A0A6A5S4D8_9PLEO|nr:condensation-domain-containing protein [Didymella exigua CBS 183.55]KAF1934460.1 condensation-domain-containing protein [Didymella exigua CBS 183.55]
MEPKFSLLRMNDDELDSFLEEKLEEADIDLSEVEDIYPCAPIQEGIQLSKLVPSAPDYNVVATISIESVRDGDCVDLRLVRKAWQQVVDRHAILRTIFVESVEYGRFSDQIVLFHAMADVQELQSFGERITALEFSERRPAHCFSLISKDRQSVHCRLEIDHTLTDGFSVAIIMRDLASAYTGQLPRTPAPKYSDYIAFLQRDSGEAHLQYWTQLLAGAQPCLFPTPSTLLSEQSSSIQVTVPVPNIRSSVLHAFCRKLNVTLFNVIQAAWAIVLQSYTQSKDVSFGYVTSGRDLPIERVESIMGPLINTLICRTQLRGSSQSLAELIKGIQTQYLAGTAHQTTSLGSVYDALGMRGRRLFNTAVFFRPLHLDSISNDTVRLSLIGRKSYTEFDLSVSLERSDKVEISLCYSPRTFSHKSITAIASTLSKVLQLLPKSAKIPVVIPQPLV